MKSRHDILKTLGHRRSLLCFVVAIGVGLTCLTRAEALVGRQQPDAAQDITVTDPAEAARREAHFLTSPPMQITIDGSRAGEGYFSRDGNWLIYQSEQMADNPFYQIYLMNLADGTSRRVSPGYGKTTCAWIHPDGKRVLFASTQDDPDAVKKQQEELKARAEGVERRYAWDYDENFDIYSVEIDELGKQNPTYHNLTNVKGYDAEGSYSPDGKLIAFASNRNAYVGEMPAEQKKTFDADPSVMMDIYVMNADGTGVRQLTDVFGYDGGPFFSPDGKRICWRRFAPNGMTAEIMTMNIDGTDQKKITRMDAMSWAPFYHPSGKYLIFTTNKHGFNNFELYIVDTDGKHDPVRVTYTPGFDGLPVFTPDGKQLYWTRQVAEHGPSGRAPRRSSAPVGIMTRR